MASLRALAHKLQTALLYHGIKIKINQMQTYSAKNDRMVTKYMVYEYRPDEKPKNVTLLETYQIADVVKLLASRYSDGG